MVGKRQRLHNKLVEEEELQAKVLDFLKLAIAQSRRQPHYAMPFRDSFCSDIDSARLLSLGRWDAEEKVPHWCSGNCSPIARGEIAIPNSASENWNCIRSKPAEEMVRTSLLRGQSRHRAFPYIDHFRMVCLARYSNCSSLPMTICRAFRLSKTLCSSAFSFAIAEMRAGSWVSTRIFSFTRTSCLRNLKT